MENNIVDEKEWLHDEFAKWLNEKYAKNSNQPPRIPLQTAFNAGYELGKKHAINNAKGRI